MRAAMTRYRLVDDAGAEVAGQEFEGIGLEGAIIEARMRAIRYRLRMHAEHPESVSGYAIERFDSGAWLPARCLEVDHSAETVES
jgi:hypothetical protein